MDRKIFIGSRGSKLAMLYAKKAKDQIVKSSDLNDEDVVIKKIYFLLVLGLYNY